MFCLFLDSNPDWMLISEWQQKTPPLPLLWVTLALPPLLSPPLGISSITVPSQRSGWGPPMKLPLWPWWSNQAMVWCKKMDNANMGHHLAGKASPLHVAAKSLWVKSHVTLRGRAGASIWDCWTDLRDAPNDGFWWEEPWLRIRHVHAEAWG